MNYCTVCNTRSKLLTFDLPQYARDEKLAFVEHVCSLMLEGRFGPDRAYDMVTYLQPKPDKRIDIFFLATAEGFLPAYDIEPVSSAVLNQIEEDIALRRGVIFVERALNKRTPSNLSRGSPLSEPPALAGGTMSAYVDL